MAWEGQASVDPDIEWVIKSRRATTQHVALWAMVITDNHCCAAWNSIAEVGGTKFANCFICNESGHLSKNCPRNTHGIYPKGGSCKICGGVTHLARDCPHKGNRGSNAANGIGRTSTQHEETRRGQVTKFVSGDDLDDDFLAEDTYSKSKSSESKSGPTSDFKESSIKGKTKQGPKVVNFVG
ncbi:hypothetical protein Acr_02g0001570 [Actinidia rufa]|uniref:CCHC-type domain-containing protein n=1 Tax=Actinidia rufa TaxID=165716 RepID=A0A7J0E8A7_9ERIC|nr:hypothetical protein Acr_02g0001570 [Actinidia rufa]